MDTVPTTPNTRSGPVEMSARAHANRTTEGAQASNLDLTAHLATIVDCSSDAVCSSTLEGNILSWNAGAERILGYKADEIVGMSILTLVPDDCIEELARVHERILRQDHVPPFETVRVHRDGRRISLSLGISPIDDEHGEIVAYSTIARELSTTGGLHPHGEHRHPTADDQGISRLNLEGVCRELDALSYAISHDLRAPLRAIRGFSEILLRRYSDCIDDDGRHLLDNVCAAGKQMDLLIDDLLAYARLGCRGVSHRLVSLHDLFACLVHNHSVANESTRVEFHLPDDLPDVVGDWNLLHKVFENLIDNAITYCEADVSPIVRVDWSRIRDRVVVSVRDNGIGISSEFHTKIFNICQRLHTTEQYPGTGVGLGIVKKALELLGGRIWLESDPGKGSVFFVELADSDYTLVAGSNRDPINSR